MEMLHKANDLSTERGCRLPLCVTMIYVTVTALSKMQQHGDRGAKSFKGTLCLAE